MEDILFLMVFLCILAKIIYLLAISIDDFKHKEQFMLQRIMPEWLNFCVSISLNTYENNLLK